MMPPAAEFRFGVADESADVSPDERDPKLVELQHPDDRPSEVFPV